MAPPTRFGPAVSVRNNPQTHLRPHSKFGNTPPSIRPPPPARRPRRRNPLFRMDVPDADHRDGSVHSFCRIQIKRGIQSASYHRHASHGSRRPERLGAAAGKRRAGERHQRRRSEMVVNVLAEILRRGRREEKTAGTVFSGGSVF